LKKILVILLLLCFAFPSYSQEEDRRHYFITMDEDTITGRLLADSPNEVVIKTEDQTKSVFQPSQIKQYGGGNIRGIIVSREIVNKNTRVFLPLPKKYETQSFYVYRGQGYKCYMRYRGDVLLYRISVIEQTSGYNIASGMMMGGGPELVYIFYICDDKNGVSMLKPGKEKTKDTLRAYFAEDKEAMQKINSKKFKADDKSLSNLFGMEMEKF
jgi:hypothetical protein